MALVVNAELERQPLGLTFFGFCKTGFQSSDVIINM